MESDASLYHQPNSPPSLVDTVYIHTGMWFARGFDKSGRTFCVRAHSTSSWGSFARCAHAASYSGIALKAADFMTFTKVSSEGYLHGQETYLH